MSGPTISLVQHGKPRRLSGVEIQALTAERVAALKVRREAERAAAAAELAAWRKGEAAKSRARAREQKLLSVLLLAVMAHGFTVGRLEVGFAAGLFILAWASFLVTGRW